MRRCQSGFTLVELLVVMAIVAVLGSLLMPALHNARDSAREAQCASNQRQLAAAFQNYSADWDGILPRSWTPDGGPSISTLGLRAGERDWAVDTLPYVQNELLYVCPSKRLIRGYGFNLWLAWNDGMNVEDIAYPSRTVMFAEILGKAPTLSVYDFTPFCTPEAWPVDARFQFEPRHHGGGNIAFADGHVKWVPSSRYTQWSVAFGSHLAETPVSTGARGTPVGTYWWPTKSNPPG